MKRKQKINRMSAGANALLFSLILVICSFMLACENPFVTSLLPDRNGGNGYNYAVTFDKNYGETNTIHSVIYVRYPATTVDALPPPPVWGDYVFHSWNTDKTGNGDNFTEYTEVTDDITVYAKWATGSLSGSASITALSSYRIGQKLTVDTASITGASSPFVYQWKADDVNIPDAINNEYTIKGADAGKLISCEITHNSAAGSVTATGAIVPYEVTIGSNIIGKEGSDAVSVNPSFGLVDANISINYTLAASKNNNRLELSGVNQSITPITTTGTSSIIYKIAAIDAANGLITINAVFTHSNLTLDTIAFDDTKNVEKTYGDATFTRTVSNSGAGTGAIKYTSGNTDVATADSGTGAVTIKAAGTTTIIAEKEESATHAKAVASYTLIIGKKPVTITGLTAANKVYDGTTNVTISGTPSIQSQVVNSDNVTIVDGTARFNNKNAENGKTVIFENYSLAGNHKDNYELTAQPTATANISKLKLTLTQASLDALLASVVKTKAYDETDNASISTQPVLGNKIGTDDVHVSAEAAFNSANVSEANKITIVYNIGGMDSSNYAEPDNLEITDGVSITKAAGRDVSVPAMSTKSSSTIVVSPVTITPPVYSQVAEYAIAKASSPVPTTGWQTSNSFSGLDAGTTYYVFARSKETVNVHTGAAKTSAAIATNAAAGAPTLFTKIDFQNDNIGSTTKYVTTEGNGTAAITIVNDSTPAGNKALQVVTSNYNQAAIIPINLPYELHEYKKISIRIRPTSGTTSLNGKSLQIYAGASPSEFSKWAFGNETDAEHSMVPRRIGRSPTLNFGEAPYINVWTTFELDNIAAAGTTIVGNLKGNAYIAVGLNVDNTAGTYLIDDIDFILRDGFEPPPPPPSFPQPPSIGAVASGNYRNVFLERGLWTQQQIDAKVQDSWNRLLNPNASEDYRIYYEVSTPIGPGAYILDSGNNDIRSEGMSYGMMMAVQMNDKEMFDRLWTWAKHFMYCTTDKGNNTRGYFNWQMNTNGTVKGNGIAPDGEFYFATALLFAHARWGSNTGTGTMVPGSGSGATNEADLKNYRWHAMLLLYDMCHREMGNGKDPYDAPGLFRRPGDHRTTNTVASPMALGNYMPVFSPIGQSAGHTDPSYHLPSFNEVWAYELKKDANAGNLHGIWKNAADMITDAEFYERCAQTSRDFFTTTIHSTTGLNPDYANFNGSPNSNQPYFGYDAFRTVMNVAMDYAWWAKDSRQTGLANRLLNFFHSQGVNTYKSIWDVAGTPWPSNPGPGDHSPGLVAMNASAGLVATNQNTWDFVEDFWNISMTAGQWRYYDGCLYMFGMLHLSGNYKVYLSGGTYVSDSSIAPSTATFDKRPSQQKDITVEMTLHGNEFTSIQNGQTILTQETHYTRSGTTITLLKSYLATLNNGNVTLTFNFSAGRSRSIDINVITSPVSNSAVSPITAVFAKSAPSPILVTMTLNGNTLSSIRNGANTLTQGSNYTLSGSNVTISETYLSGLTEGTQTLTFIFNEGSNATLTITVQQYKPSEIVPVAASFYRDTKEDIEVIMTLNGNTFTGIQNGGTTLTENTHYTRNGNTVKILGTYLGGLSGSSVTLTFVFNQGGNKQLVISMKDVNPDRMVVIDFESAAPAITFTGGGGTPTATVLTNPTIPNEKSLRINVTGGNNWNRAPIIPINLPQELQYYESVSFKYYVQSAEGATTRDFRLYADTVNNSFPSNQFGNNNAYFNERLIGGFQINLNETGVWKEHTIPINSLPNTINNLKGNAFIAIGFNHGDPYTYFLDDITFVLKSDYVVPATISPSSATFYKAAGEQEDITVIMTTNGHSLTSIQNSGTPLTSGTNYTVSGNVVTLLKSYLAGLSTGETTLTFNFSKGPSSSIKINVENDKASSLVTSYNFSTSVDPAIVTFDGTGLSALWKNEEGGILEITKTTGYSTPRFILPFNLGTTNLGNYSQIIINVKKGSGDVDDKTFRVRSGSTVLGTASTGRNLSNFYDLVITLPTSGLSSLTGNIPISFEFDNTNPYVVQIKSIRLVP